MPGLLAESRHTVAVGDRKLEGFDRFGYDAHTLESAMQIEPHMRELVGRTCTQNTYILRMQRWPRCERENHD